MRRKTTALTIVVLIAALVVPWAPVLAKEYVVMLSRNINLRTGPGTEKFVIGRAWKGDIFELVGEVDNWYEILMFSGEYRYVSKSWSAKLTEADMLPGHRMRLPAADDTLRAVYRDILHAKERAAREADDVIPAWVDEATNMAFEGILEDRHILEVMGMYGVQPALYRDLIAKVTKN